MSLSNFMPTIKIRKYLSLYEYLSNNAFLNFAQDDILEISTSFIVKMCTLLYRSMKLKRARSHSSAKFIYEGVKSSKRLKNFHNGVVYSFKSIPKLFSTSIYENYSHVDALNICNESKPKWKMKNFYCFHWNMIIDEQILKNLSNVCIPDLINTYI